MDGVTPHARALREHLHGVAADLLGAVDRLGDSACGGDVSAEEHEEIVGARRASPLHSRGDRPSPHGSVADRFPPHRRRADIPFQLALRARARRRVPASNREHGHEPRGRGIRRADRALAPLARPGLGRDRRRSSSIVWREPGRRPHGSSPRGQRTRTKVRSACGCRTDGVTGWDDAIKGGIEFPNPELEDLVIVRSDGRPTYNFASPLEDWLDGITHVIRGDDHVSNTPKQIQVLRALGAEPPVYAHVPSVFGEDGRSSRSDTVRFRWTSFERPATSPRRS